MSQPPADDMTKALEFFKDWSNYLLVTTVAAVGWVGAKESFAGIPSLKPWCMAALGLSAVFGIFTLALIPLVQEQRATQTQTKSIYRVHVDFWFWPSGSVPKAYKDGMYLTWVCFPQHVLFIVGVILYVIGTPHWNT
jgi:hypothetical protein